jgi:hypothetical protein
MKLTLNPFALQQLMLLLLLLIGSQSSSHVAVDALVVTPRLTGIRNNNPLIASSFYRVSSSRLRSSTLDKTTSNNATTVVEPLAGTWECNEEAECVMVPECNDEVCRTSLDVRIHGQWYDLSGK